MRMVSTLKDYLIGTDQPPNAAEVAVHADVEHRHWDRVTRTWIEHGSGGQETAEAA